jgi:hypothetical protein
MFHGYRVELYDNKNTVLNKLRELCEFDKKTDDSYQCRSKNGEYLGYVKFLSNKIISISVRQLPFYGPDSFTGIKKYIELLSNKDNKVGEIEVDSDYIANASSEKLSVKVGNREFEIQAINTADKNAILVTEYLWGTP